MSIHNVSATGFEHLCVCGAQASHQHADLVKVKQEEAYKLPATGPRLQHILCADGFEQVQIVCVNGHIECLLKHPATEEISATRAAAEREQIRNNRLVHQHLGVALP